MKGQLDIPRHVLGGEIVGVDAAVEGLYFTVVGLRTQVQAVEVDAEQGALIVQHPETVAFIEGDAPPAQVILRRVVRGGGLRLSE